MEAFKSLSDLLAQAERCRVLFERASISLPEPLKRILGMSENAAKGGVSAHSVPEPQRPPAPVGAKSDWPWVAVEKAGATSVALAILRDHAPLKARSLHEQVGNLLPSVNSGTINNMGTRLDGTVISRAEDGWRLIDETKAPIMLDGYLWGPKTIFTVHEIAAYRREMILHLLGSFNAGLQTSQIIELLRKAPWVQAPVNKELVQDDIEVLKADDKIRRRGTSKKWELAPVRKEG